MFTSKTTSCSYKWQATCVELTGIKTSSSRFFDSCNCFNRIRCSSVNEAHSSCHRVKTALIVII